MKNWRSKIIFALVLVGAAAIIGRLFYVQILQGKFYQAQALGEQKGFKEIQGNRGQIFSTNSGQSKGQRGFGEIISFAVNKDKWLVSALPSQIKDKNIFAEQVSKAINQSADSVLQDLSSPSYVIIKKSLSDQELTDLRKLKLAGLNLENSRARYYPQEAMAAQTIGFLGGDDNGQYGLEGYYDDILQGKQGIQETKTGLDLISSDDNLGSLDGSDVYLTIDSNIQFEAESLLRDAEKEFSIDSGQIVVMKPDSGRILALANYPSFNLNNYGAEKNMVVFQNAVVQQLFEPGSVFKPFTMAMALNDGKVTPDTIFTDTGSVKIGPDTISNFDHKIYGKGDMSHILEKSINVGAVFLEQKLSHQTFFDYLDKFGVNEKTGVDLQGEVSSQNTVLKKGPDMNYATASFGQGIEMTPIQLIKAFSIFANNGKTVNPFIAEKIVRGKEEQDIKPEISDQIFSQKTVSEATTMLINVVERGFGNGAKIPGYYIAGKTGTAQVPLKNGRGYEPNKTIQSFIGYAPAWKPQFEILVKFDDPKVPESALSAVPYFKKMAQYIINYWQIPPDYDVKNEKK